MKGLTILIVEDDVSIGWLLTEILTSLGYEVSSVEANEAGAVAAAERRRPDLMIVDIGLAEGGGVAAVERITRAAPIPHVFMSGLGPLEAVPDAVLLRKPFREADLVGAIDRALRRAAPPG